METLKALDIITGLIDEYADELEPERLAAVEEAEVFLYKYVNEKENA